MSFNPCSRGCFARSRTSTCCRTLNRCFNPCSRGCFARSETMQIDLNGIDSFNPCSRGCFARSFAPITERILFYRFQSLFSWMFRSKTRSTGDTLAAAGFNPCSRGCFARRPKESAVIQADGVSILVLVDVSLEALLCCMLTYSTTVSILVLVDVSLEAIAVIATGSILECFNPCSRGCFARRIPGRVQCQGREEFQSLFSWMFRSKRHAGDYERTHAGFQSLFSWMFRSKLKMMINEQNVMKFQSLFSWMFRSKLPDIFIMRGDLRVSILVLVDVSLEGH